MPSMYIINYKYNNVNEVWWAQRDFGYKKEALT